MEGIKKSYEIVSTQPATLAEGPVWDHQQKRIVWVDIAEGHIFQYRYLINQYSRFNAGKMVGAVAVCSDGKIVAAVKNGFEFIDMESGTVDPISYFLNDDDIRFNDGKCDAAGRFWAGTMSMTDIPQHGSLYCLDNNLNIRERLDGVGCSNGIAWSADNKTMYYVDTALKNVCSFDFDLETGTIERKKVIVTFSDNEGLPDGMTIDTEGMLWVALWGGWKVVRCNPFTGEKLSYIELPVAQVSSCTFGGEELGDLYVTTASIGIDKESQPLAGHVFLFKDIGNVGFPANQFLI